MKKAVGIMIGVLALALLAVPVIMGNIFGHAMATTDISMGHIGMGLAIGSIADIFSTRTMLAAIEKFKPVRTALLDLFFSKTEQSFTENVDIDIYEGTRRVAPFVHHDLPGKLVERKGFVTKTFTPPYIKLLSIASASEVFKNRPIGSNLYTSVPGNLMQRAVELLAKDLREFDQMVTRREELMAQQVVTTGKVTVTGEGYDGGASAFTIDFNQPSDFRPTLSGDALFTADACDPFAAFREWRRKITKATGYTATEAIFSQEALTAFIKNKVVQEVMLSRNINLGAVQRSDLPNGLISYGNIEGFNIYSYDEWYLDDWTDPSTPVEQPFIPAKTILLGVNGSITRNARHYGAIVDLEDENAGLNAHRLFPKSWLEKNPSRLQLLLQSAPIVCGHEVKSFMCPQVVA